MDLNLVIAVTDGDWLDILRRQPNLAEVNFWAPSAANFSALQPGELFLFKLHAPRNMIVGGGIFAYATTLPCSLAWEAFHEANGARSAQDSVIGEIREARVHLSVNFIDAADPLNVRFQPALGGGALLDMGCYTVNAARMIFNAQPRRAIARLSIDSRYDVDRNVHGMLEFDAGTALISCGFDTQGLGHYSIIGTKGMIEVPRGFIPGYGTFAAEAMIVVIDGDGNRREEHLIPVDQYGLMADDFCDAIAGGKEPLLPPSDSIRNMEVLDALQRSSKSGLLEAVAPQA